MDFGDRARRGAGWLFLGLVAVLTSMGYHYGNIRFVPVAAGFGILAVLCLVYPGGGQVSDGIHPGADSGID